MINLLLPIYLKLRAAKMWHNLAWLLAGVGLTIAVEACIGVWLISHEDGRCPGDN